MKLTIPQVRDEMHQLSGALIANAHDPDFVRQAAKRYAELADETKRKPYLPKRSMSCRGIDAELAKEIRQYARLHPTTGQLAIAAHFNTNQGNVSLALNHKR